MKPGQLLMVGLVLMFAALASYAAAPAGHYAAMLVGANEVPPVETDARGHAIIHTGDPDELSYRITVTDLERPAAAHIHLGKPGENGPVVALLYSAPRGDVKIVGVLAQGVITKDDLVGPMQGKSLSALVDEIKAGNTYVNVHTESRPDGEIRGQITAMKHCR